MAEATGTIEPTPPSTLMDRIYNYMNQDYNLRDELQLNSRKQPEQELKPAMNPLLQGIFNLLGGGLEGAIPNDPVIESLVKGGQFATELIKDPLNFTLAGKGYAGAKMALTPFMIARRKEIQQTLKNFDEDPILKGNESVRTSLKKELDRINKTEAEELRIAKQYDEFVKDPTKFGKKQPTKEIADSTKKTGRNEPVPKDMLRDMQADYIKSRKGPTEIPPVLYDRRSLDDEALDFDKAFLRGEYTTQGSNPNFNKPGSIQFTGEEFPMRYTYSGSYAKYMNDPKKLKELKLETGPDLRYSTQQDPTLIQDAFSGQYPELKQLFHGSQNKGIKSLELPTGNTNVSTGGIFSTVDPADPRFKQFAKGLKSRGAEGSGYVLKPNFKKPLDINDMPDDMLKTLQDIEMYRGRPSRGGAKKLDFDINTVLRGSPMTGGKTPSGIDKEFADIFTGQGYDAIRFPPRGMKGERSTMVSLDPSNLEIVDEIPYDQLDDFIRTLLNDL